MCTLFEKLFLSKEMRRKTICVVLYSLNFLKPVSTRYSIYRRLSCPQEQSGHEGEKEKISNPSDTREQTRAVQHVVKRLAA